MDRTVSSAALPDPQAIAETVRDRLWKDDRASQGLGMRIVAITPNSAMTPSPMNFATVPPFASMVDFAIAW